MTDLQSTARRLVETGKGIIALDESEKSATKRLASYGIPSTGETRRDFRELFLTTRGAEEFLSGAILCDETIRQVSRKGMPIPDLMKGRGIAIGIKVDEGLEPLSPGSKEEVTKGIEHLEGKLPEYVVFGAEFAKWRATIVIDGATLPSDEDIETDVHRLALYAKIAQSHGLVPIVEPEVLMTGNHPRKRAEEVIEQTLTELFDELKEEGVDLRGLILKTSMAVSGKESGVRDEPHEVAESTLAALSKTVPEEVPGVVFLSGGQTPEQATQNLRSIAERGPHPWQVTFSYARALQEEALTIWGGRENRWGEAQAAFFSRLKKVAAAVKGE
jgi:fructose-bisphosphate aldolase class I